MNAFVLGFVDKTAAEDKAAELFAANLHVVVTGEHDFVEIRHNDKFVTNLAGFWLVVASDEPIKSVTS